MPAENSFSRVRYATPGVVITPALTTVVRDASSPVASTWLIHALDSRVSCPMTTRAVLSRCAKRWPSARPIAYTVVRSSGYSPATPRIPSVPNNSRLMFFSGVALKAGLLPWMICPS